MIKMRDMSKSAADAEFCSTRDAAELLGVSIKTAQLWVESGVLQAWKTPGGHRRIRRSSVDTLLLERQRLSGAVAPDAAATERRLKILTVDDDPQIQKLYELNFSSWDIPHQHLTASNGFEGLLMLGEHAPDVLITDLQMPGMDGFRMLESLRKSRTHRETKIIIVSGLGTAEIRDRGGVPDGVELFGKPVAFDRLQQHIRKLVVVR